MFFSRRAEAATYIYIYILGFRKMTWEDELLLEKNNFKVLHILKFLCLKTLSYDTSKMLKLSLFKNT